jgi:hypothetical protein
MVFVFFSPDVSIAFAITFFTGVRRKRYNEAGIAPKPSTRSELQLF